MSRGWSVHPYKRLSVSLIAKLQSPSPYRRSLGSRLQLAEAMGHSMATAELFCRDWGKGQSSGMSY